MIWFMYFKHVVSLDGELILFGTSLRKKIFKIKSLPSEVISVLRQLVAGLLERKSRAQNLKMRVNHSPCRTKNENMERVLF